MDDEEPRRPKPVELLLQGLGWVFVTTVSLPLVVVWMLSTMVPAVVRLLLVGVAPAALLVVATAHVPLALQVLAIVLATTWLTFLALQLTVEGDAAQARILPDDRILQVVSLLVLATAVFASATFVLAEHRLVTIVGWRSLTSPALATVAFYAWHVVDAIPLLDATRALQWSEPLAYQDHRLGVLLVLFKLVIIIPVVGAVRAAWRARNGDAPAEPQAPGLAAGEGEQGR
jgi:hypothetical protein